MLVDLVQTTTRDGLRLDGMYQAPSSGGGPVDAFVFVHGTGSNFYGPTLFDALGERLLAAGIGVLRINTRGHDLMSTAATSRGGQRQGAAFEVLDHCRHDLAAWAEWLRSRVGPRLGLLGHSSGALKCLYAQAREPEVAATRLVAISPPRLAYSVFLASEFAREFRDTYERASALVAAGEPSVLLDVRLPLPFVVTAAGYVEKYGPTERYDYAKVLADIRCPVLFTLGELETRTHAAFRGAADLVREIAPEIQVEIVAEADHFYSGAAREELGERMMRWLKGV